MSTDYSAAIDTSDMTFSYGEEVVWGTLPAVAFKALRLTGESLSENKQRARPQEINATGVVSHAITTQVGVEGALNMALSGDTFDDFIAGALNSTFAGGTVSNGVAFRSFYLQKKMATALWLRYAGVYVTSFQLNASVGNFVEGSFGLMAKSEAKAVADASTGAITAAPSGRVIDTVAGVAGLEIDDVAITTPIQSLQINLTKQNARAQYAIGSADAQGMGRGTIDVSGTVSMYFKDFTMYDLYKNETDIKLDVDLTDDLGDGYRITLPAVTLMNPTIVAGGPDQDVMAEFQLEGNPLANVIMTVLKLP